MPGSPFGLCTGSFSLSSPVVEDPASTRLLEGFFALDAAALAVRLAPARPPWLLFAEEGLGTSTTGTCLACPAGNSGPFPLWLAWCPDGAASLALLREPCDCRTTVSSFAPTLVVSTGFCIASAWFCLGPCSPCWPLPCLLLEAGSDLLPLRCGG